VANTFLLEAKMFYSEDIFFKVVIVTYVTLEGDEIGRRSSNLVTLRKNEIAKPRDQCPRPDVTLANYRAHSVETLIPEKIMG
jgi:hypothetical protein